MTQGGRSSAGPCALGLDFSTQSVKAVLLDAATADLVYAASFEYDATLPRYGTRGGVLPSERPEIRHTSPFLLIEALDLAFERLRESGVDPGRVGAVKADAMQHCTVYAGDSFGKRLASLDPERPLLPQLRPGITRRTSPIWEDRSPAAEASYLTRALAGHGSIEGLTGNRAELRFPAAQILKWAAESPDEYARTTHVFLLSAFLTSILAGRIAPVDTGDGWGTNLNTLDIDRPGWSDAALEAADDYLRSERTGLHLRDRLGEMVEYDAVAGRISPYFAARYGISPGALVLAGTGDNPATLLGCGGGTVISLGSSYTVNGAIRDIAPSPTGEYNVFGYLPGGAMALAVFSNGAKVHERFLATYTAPGQRGKPSDEDWEAYVSAAGKSMLRDDERLMLPYLFEESVPLRPAGIVRDGFDEHDAEANIRALHVSQALALRLHSGHLGRHDALCVAGGASRNRFLRQLIADAFGAGVHSIRHADFAAPLGCAVSGARALLGISYEEAAARFVQNDTDSSVEPIAQNRDIVPGLLRRYRALEERAGTQREGASGPAKPVQRRWRE